MPIFVYVCMYIHTLKYTSPIVGMSYSLATTSDHACVVLSLFVYRYFGITYMHMYVRIYIQSGHLPLNIIVIVTW